MSLPGVFSPGLIFIGGTCFALPGTKGYQLQDLLVLKFLGGGLGEYFDAQQVGHLGQLVDASSVQILYLLGLNPVLRIY